MPLSLYAAAAVVVECYIVCVDVTLERYCHIFHKYSVYLAECIGRMCCCKFP